MARQQLGIAPAAANDAVTKEYLDLKVDKPTLNFRIPGTDGSALMTTYTLASGPTASTIAYRGTGGVLEVGTPTASAHAATKLYVDTADNLRAPKASPVFTGQATFGGQPLLGVTGSFAVDGSGPGEQATGLYIADLGTTQGTTLNPTFTLGLMYQTTSARSNGLAVDSSGYLWGFRSHSNPGLYTWQSKTKFADALVNTNPINKGGTNGTAVPTAGAVPYGTGTAYAFTAAGTQNQVLKSNAAGAPTWQTLDLTYLPDAAFKKSVKAATTAHITLSGAQTIDGISLVAGDRCLVKNNTNPAQNGIYTVAAGAWTRAGDADSASEIAGAVVNIDSGTQGGQLWTNSFKTTDTIGTTAMVWDALATTTAVQAALTAAAVTPIRLRAYVNANYTFTDTSVWTPVRADVETDPNGIYNNTSGTVNGVQAWHFKPGKIGKFLVSGALNFQLPGTGVGILSVTKNGQAAEVARLFQDNGMEINTAKGITFAIILDVTSTSDTFSVAHYANVAGSKSVNGGEAVTFFEVLEISTSVIVAPLTQYVNRVARTANAAVAVGTTSTVVPFGTVVTNESGTFDSAGAFTAAVDGLYSIKGRLSLNSAAADTVTLSLAVNGSNVASLVIQYISGTNWTNVPFDIDIRLTAGQTVTLTAIRAGVASVSIVANDAASWMQITKIS